MRITYSLAGVLCLANGHTNELGTEVGEDSVDQRAPETIEFASIAGSNVWPERARILVVLETSCRSRSSADGQEERQDDDTNNDNDLDGTEPELKFTEELDTEVVDATDEEEKDQNEDSGIDLRRRNPFLNNQSSGSQLVGRRNDVLAPIGPSKGKTESRVAEAGSVTGETRAVRNPGSHFSKGSHDNVDEETDGCVSDEN